MSPGGGLATILELGSQTRAWGRVRGALSGGGGLSLCLHGVLSQGGRAQALSGDPLPSALQELLSHSTDRPERQQLKEALEAMQVGHRGRGEAG